MPDLIRICTEAQPWLGAGVGSQSHHHCTARDKEDQSSLSLPINTSSRDLVSAAPAVIGVKISEKFTSRQNNAFREKFVLLSVRFHLVTQSRELAMTRNFHVGFQQLLIQTQMRHFEQQTTCNIVKLYLLPQSIQIRNYLQTKMRSVVVTWILSINVFWTYFYVSFCLLPTLKKAEN